MILELKEAIEASQLTEAAAMNLLQENGIVSDNCITIEDIDTYGQLNAAVFLNQRREAP